MPQGFMASQLNHRNPYQHPVRSRKGGYLRCPFTISTSYAEIAEKRVQEDLARGGNHSGGGGKTAVEDKDGMLYGSSSAAAAGLRFEGDAVDGGDGGRRWSRAGVGAHKLSSKEKRAQQEQAELIYGRGNALDEDTATSTASGGPMGSGASQVNMFAVDTREQEALRRVVPRAVREKIKQRKFEETAQERRPLGQHNLHRISTSFSGHPKDDTEDNEDRLRKGNQAEGKPPHSRNSSAAPLRFGGERPLAQGFNETMPTSKDRPAPFPLQSAPSSRSTIPAAAAPVAIASRPKNRMQMLEDQRAAVLSGKKRPR